MFKNWFVLPVHRLQKSEPKEYKEIEPFIEMVVSAHNGTDIYFGLIH